MKTPMLESLFNKTANLKTCSFIKKRLQHRCYLVKFVKFLRTAFLKNICERLLPKNDRSLFVIPLRQLQKVVLSGKNVIKISKPSSESNSNDNEYFDSAKNEYFYLPESILFLTGD